jgi:hypothetical protein
MGVLAARSTGDGWVSGRPLLTPGPPGRENRYRPEVATMGFTEALGGPDLGAGPIPRAWQGVVSNSHVRNLGSSVRWGAPNYPCSRASTNPRRPRRPRTGGDAPARWRRTEGREK